MSSSSMSRRPADRLDGEDQAGPHRADSAYDAAAAAVMDSVSGDLGAADTVSIMAESSAEASSSGDRRRLAINAAAGGAANMGKIAIQLVMMPLMARLLGPAEFGIFALAMPAIALMMSLADGGLGASMAREKDEATRVWSTAFWLLLGTGLVLAVGITIWGFVLAQVSHEPRLRGIMAFLSLSFLLVTVMVLPSARLVGQGRLFIISGADFLSTVVGAVVAIALALGGAGAWALAAQYVVGVAIRTAIFNGAAFVRPRAVFDFPLLKSHLSTGTSLLGGRLSDFTGRLVENVSYERLFGAAALGNYTFSNQAPRFICEAASGPIWAALYAHALRSDPDEIAAMHVKLIRILSLLVFPMAFLLSAAAPEVVDRVLGNQWDAAAGLLQIFVPFYALSVVANQSGAIMLASGRGWISFWITFATTVGRVVAVGLGLWFGQTGVAWGIGLVLTASASVLLLTQLTDGAPYGRALAGAVVTPVLAAALSGVICFLALRTMNPTLPAVIVGLLIGGVSYLVLIAILQGRQLRSDLDAIRRIVLGRRAA